MRYKYKLVQEKEDLARLIVVDENGNEFPNGKLLRITPNGIIREFGVNQDIGLPLDRSGRINVVE